jgi:cytochrome c-type biogenesis protein CcmH/NrfG
MNHARVLSSLGLDDKSIEENLLQEPNAETWSYLGLCYLHKRDFENSKQAFEKALELSPEENKKEVLLCIVQLYYNQNNIDKAKANVAQW